MLLPLLTPGDAKRLRTHESVPQLSVRAKKRLEWIAHFAENVCSVSETCRKFGISRSTFYRVLERFDAENLFLSRRQNPFPRITAERIGPSRRYPAHPRMPGARPDDEP